MSQEAIRTQFVLLTVISPPRLAPTGDKSSLISFSSTTQLLCKSSLPQEEESLGLLCLVYLRSVRLFLLCYIFSS